jgi:uncharacterized protein
MSNDIQNLNSANGKQSREPEKLDDFESARGPKGLQRSIRLSSLEEKESLLLSTIEETEKLIVAYSGGVDSSLLAYYARKALGDRAKVVIAVSPSLAQYELDAARSQADSFNWNLIEIKTDEVDKPEYQRNDQMRCYFCKSTLFAALDKLARDWEFKNIAYGANVDDLRDFRPGQKAAKEFNVLSPLQTAKLSKDEIRALAKQAGLPSWDRPQAACLSSRFPTWQPVTVTLLSQVERAEAYLHRLGFEQVRVRHHDHIARIELAQEELARLLTDTEAQRAVIEHLKSLGYEHVTVDLEGYKQGSSNRLLVDRGESA